MCDSLGGSAGDEQGHAVALAPHFFPGPPGSAEMLWLLAAVPQWEATALPVLKAAEL